MMESGPGRGGSCFGKDTLSLVESLHLVNVAMYWRGAVTTNRHQEVRFRNCVVVSMPNGVTNAKNAVPGFAFK